MLRELSGNVAVHDVESSFHGESPLFLHWLHAVSDPPAGQDVTSPAGPGGTLGPTEKSTPVATGVEPHPPCSVHQDVPHRQREGWPQWRLSRRSGGPSTPPTSGRPTCTSTSSSSTPTCSRTTRPSGAARTTAWPTPSASSRRSPPRASGASPTPPSWAWAATSPASSASPSRCRSSTSSRPPVATPTTRSRSSSSTGDRPCRRRPAPTCPTRWWTCSSATSPRASPAPGSRPRSSSAPSTTRA